VGVRGTGRDLNRVSREKGWGVRAAFFVKSGSSVSFPGQPVVGRQKLR
jgi:hypothetical protein